ncbi:HlyD family type I secretion periplasmic adaptor subunit [Paludibacterium paludis]|uniref:Membrane fusion protein (MFP) family protein n=1 Tax=Paludibacterium paludis TaxID=1225769 RepID=A0A918P5H6_9NEIS|nr:HlyD family type I secretion periplasmic adaptor subunit [Paludibacterium paludis]GGY23270.1 HlyD family type I secretion periplasmic adaptor subunit [Paludibacterium paludis]
MKIGLEALAALCRRYGEVFVTAWRHRAQFEPVRRANDEREFLPAHLELIETPVSPLPMWTIRLLILIAVLTVAWAAVGRMDIVAVSTGRIVSGGRTKMIQPAQGAVVSAIKVRDGQHVAAGELLLELDAVGADADHRKTGDALRTAYLDASRFEGLLRAADSGTSPRLAAVDGVEPSRLAAEVSLAEGQWRAYQSRRDALSAVLAQREAELATLQQQIRKLQGSALMAQEREKDYRDLLAKNFVSRHAYLEKQQQHAELQSEIAVQQSRVKEVRATLASQRQELASLRAEFRKDALDQLRQANERIAQLQEEIRKTGAQQSRMRLVSPVAGTVQQLAIHTVGGVVTEAQPLMAIVPDGDALEAETWIDNQDIGFVRPGQSVVVKVDSFPYTRYGYLEGTVESVSSDAVRDESRGWGFTARIRLKRDRLVIDGKPVKLTPGMTVSAEIRTGTRRVISYFLGPLQEYASESFRER